MIKPGTFVKTNKALGMEVETIPMGAEGVVVACQAHISFDCWQVKLDNGRLEDIHESHLTVIHDPVGTLIQELSSDTLY